MTFVKTAKRSSLVSTCLQKSLITEDDAVAVRSVRGCRRAVLVAALQRLGCELRGDSRLCDDYIEHGSGDPDEISKVMREMKFYHEHTEYAAIREEIYHNARQEFEDEMSDDDGYYDRDFRRPRFSDYFDPRDASDEAQRAAFERWMAA